MLSDEELRALVCADNLQHDPDCGIYAVRSFRNTSEQEGKLHQALINRVSARLSESPVRS
jgi:hypothetical protein